MTSMYSCGRVDGDISINSMQQGQSHHNYEIITVCDEVTLASLYITDSIILRFLNLGRHDESSKILKSDLGNCQESVCPFQIYDDEEPRGNLIK
jgi:hypothetical protein